MNKLPIIILCFGITFILTACNPKFYSPNIHNVPLLETKGDGNISVSGNGGRFEFQGSYGISDQIGIQLNGGLFNPKDLDNGNGGSVDLCKSKTV